MTAEKIILGIDPGTLLMGYGAIRVRGKQAEMVAAGVVDMRKTADLYLRLGMIYDATAELIKKYLPDELAIEAPFLGQNTQTLLKLGRAQGVAIATAIHYDVPIHEYAPMKIKLAITGNGSASKDQVAAMVRTLLHISEADVPKYRDATDALAAAYCHYMQSAAPQSTAPHYKDWKDYALRHGK